MIELLNEDCMARYPDKYFDLAIVDPPCGIGANKMTLGNGKRKVYRGEDNWDSSAPDEAYFKELMRVSKHQIIWGANHFISKIPFDSSCWIFWDKGTGDNDFADGELAWTSFDGALRKIFISWVGANAKENNEPDRIHPTTKPVKLYSWILSRWGKKEFKILDTHLGSGSSAIAAHNFGSVEFVGTEIDKKYFNDTVKRFNLVTSQTKLF